MGVVVCEPNGTDARTIFGVRERAQLTPADSGVGAKDLRELAA